MGWKDKIPRMRSGEGAHKQVNDTMEQIEDVQEPMENIQVERGDDENGVTETMTAEQYKQRLSDIVSKQLIGAYHAGKEEGRMEANNEDKRFKAIMLGTLMSGAHFIFWLYVAYNMGWI